VKVFQTIIKAKGETSKEYIINTFSYTLKGWHHIGANNYMLEFSNWTFSKLIQTSCKRHQKTQNDKYIYMEFKNIRQRKIEHVEMYYEYIQKLGHELQTPTIHTFFDHRALNKIIVLYEDCTCRNEEDHVTIA
jgi:hypothetical protein